MRTNRILLLQGIYYLITGAWPLIDIDSFMQVTGPKNDIWLVRMVGLLTVAVAITLLVHRSSVASILRTLSISTATSYLLIDLYYSLNDIISPVYLADAAAEMVIIALVALAGFRERRRDAGTTE